MNSEDLFWEVWFRCRIPVAEAASSKFGHTSSLIPLDLVRSDIFWLIEHPDTMCLAVAWRAKKMLTGYLHPTYAESLAEIGSPLRLPRSGGCLLRRSIPNTRSSDAVGCYPLLACQDWRSLRHDLDELSDVVSVVAVADPFGAADEKMLRESFRDLVRPFKDHSVVELRHDPNSFVSKHHLRNTERALHQVEVTVCEKPILFLDDWQNLYAQLIERHAIRGAARFSCQGFALQFSIPGLTLLRASRAGVTVGLNMWYTLGNRAYYHLGAYSAVGYKVRASFALFWTAIGYFQGTGLDWLELGAGAGATGSSDDEDGLSRFKRGWATDTRTAYICGRICDSTRYEQLTASSGPAPFDYFPDYRWPEVSLQDP